MEEPPPAEERPPAPPEEISWRRKLISLGIGLVLLIAISALLGAYLAEPLESVGRWLLETFGLGGLFALVFALDAWPLPALPHEPALLLGVSGGVPLLHLALLAAVASVTAAWLDFALGRYLARRGLGERVLGKHLVRAEGLLARYGAWGVAGIAIVPFPFAIVALAAGTLQMPARPFLLATLLRFPKAGVTVWLIAQGWALGAG